jgi:hypothetical protein
MDVDVAQMQQGRLSEEERKRLRNEGRCFFCKNQGHLSHQCPKKTKSRTENPPRSRTFTARTIKTDEATVVNAIDAKPDRMAILKGIQGMSATERSQLLDDLIMSDQPSVTSF